MGTPNRAESIRGIPRSSHRRYNNRDISGHEAVSLRYGNDGADSSRERTTRESAGERGTKRRKDCWMRPSISGSRRHRAAPRRCGATMAKYKSKSNRHPSWPLLSPPQLHGTLLSSSFAYSELPSTTGGDPVPVAAVFIFAREFLSRHSQRDARPGPLYSLSLVGISLYIVSLIPDLCLPL